MKLPQTRCINSLLPKFYGKKTLPNFSVIFTMNPDGFIKLADYFICSILLTQSGKTIDHILWLQVNLKNKSEEFIQELQIQAL